MNVTHNYSSTEKKKILTISEYRRRDMKKVLKAIEKIAEQASAIIFNNFRSQNSDITLQIKNIYNAKTKIRKKRLDKYISIQTLLKVLYKNN